MLQRPFFVGRFKILYCAFGYLFQLLRFWLARGMGRESQNRGLVECEGVRGKVLRRSPKRRGRRITVGVADLAMNLELGERPGDF